MTVQSQLIYLVVHLEGFPTCETMLLVLTHPQMFSKCLCIWLRPEEVVLPLCQRACNCGSKSWKTCSALLETEKPFNACCETLTAFPHNNSCCSNIRLNSCTDGTCRQIIRFAARPSMLGWVSALWVPNFGTLSVDGRTQVLQMFVIASLSGCGCDDERGLDFWVLVGIRGARWFAITSFPAFEFLYLLLTNSRNP